MRRWTFSDTVYILYRIVSHRSVLQLPTSADNVAFPALAAAKLQKQAGIRLKFDA